MSNKDKVKSVVAIAISIIIIFLLINTHNTDSSKSTSLKDYIKFTIVDLEEVNGTYIATVKSVKEGYYDRIDITDASMDSGLYKVIGSTLYFGDPSKHNYDPKEYLIIKEK